MQMYPGKMNEQNQRARGDKGLRLTQKVFQEQIKRESI